MKKFILLVSLAIVAITVQVKAQGVIALTTANGQTTVYSLFETALNHANNGDYIYLPGGTFKLVSDIKKAVTIIGAGHYPDSTAYTNRTIIEGDLNIGSGGSNALIEGLYVIGNIIFRPEQKTENVTIRRCNINSISIGNNWGRVDSNRCFNPQFIHNIIRGSISFSESFGFLMKGNIIGGTAQECTYHGGNFENNIFLAVGENATFSNLRNITFKNNIFMNTQRLGYQGYGCYGLDGICGTYNCNFINNLFVGKDTTVNVIAMAALRTGNIFLADASSIFVKQSGTTFDYNHNYALKPTAPGKNAGDDGTDVGIYGSTNPYKTSALPSNPHISFKDIPASTLPNGTIPLKIRVTAQDR